MAIEFRSAITIGGVAVVPGYPALSGLTAGQVLRASGSGTVAFAALVAADLPATAVTAAAYGSATQVPTFTVDAQGRLTASANVTITPAYTSLTYSGLSTGQVLRATSGTAAAFGALSLSTAAAVTGILPAANLPTNVAYKDSDNQFSVAQGVRAAATGQAAGLSVPWITGDSLPAGMFGSSSTSNSAPGLWARSGTANGAWITSTQGQPLAIERTAGIIYNAVADLLLITHSVVTAASVLAGHGAGIGFQLNSDSTNGRNAARLATFWTDPADGTRTSALGFYTVLSASAVTERMRLTGLGQLLLRSTDATQASGAYFLWVSGDALATVMVGSSTAGMNQIALSANSDSSTAVQGFSATGAAFKGLTTSGNALIGRITDSATTGAGIAIAIQHRTSGSPITADFGIAFKFQLQSTSTNDQDAAQILGGWSDPTHASRSAYLTFWTVNNAGALAERMRLTALGQLLVRSTDATQANGAYFPWITGDTLPALVAGSGGTQSTTGITVRAGTGLALYAVATTGTPLFGERLSSTLTNSTADLLVIKHTITGTAAAGLGVAMSFQLHSTVTAGRSAAKIAAVWTDPADATYTAALAFLTANSTTVAERMRLTGAGLLALNLTAPTYGIHQRGGAIRQQALGTPTGLAISNQGTAGSTTYTYWVYAVDQAGYRTLAATLATTTGNATLTGVNFNRVSWTAVAGAASYIVTRGTAILKIGSPTTNTLDDTGLSTSGITAPTHDETGDVIVDSWAGHGTTTPLAPLSVVGTATDANVYNRGMASFYFPGSSAAAGGHGAYKARGTVTAPTTVANADGLGGMFFGGYDGTNWLSTASIYALANGTVATASIPTDLIFTTDAANNTFTERMRISSAGNVGIGTAAPAALLHILPGAKEAIRLSSAAGHGSSIMSYGTSNGDALYLSANAAYTGSAWAFHNVAYPTWMLAMGNAAGDTLLVQRAPASGNPPVYANLLAMTATGFMGLGGVTAPAATLDIVRSAAVQLRLASLSGSGSTMMAYSTGTVESLYIMVNRTYSAGAFSRINTGQASWTLSMGSQDQDTFKVYREDSGGVSNLTLLQVDASGNVTTPKGGTIRADEATYAAPGAGQGLEIASTGGIGYVQSYNRGTPGWRPLQLNGSTISFGGSAAKGSFSSGGDLTINGVLFPAANGSYYLTYTASPAGLIVYGNFSCYHDIYPGNNNGTGGAQNSSYYIRGDTTNSGIRTNGSFVVNGNIYCGNLGNWLTAYLNQAVLTTSTVTFNNVNANGVIGTNQYFSLPPSGLSLALISTEPGVSYTNGLLAYNYYAFNSGSMARNNTSYGGGYLRFDGTGQITFGAIASNGTVGNPLWMGVNNVGVGVIQGASNRLFSKGVDSTSSNNAFLCQNSGGSNLMYVRNDGLVWANQAWTISDRRRKERIRDLPYGLKDILQLRATMFDMIDGAKDQLGFIAQEVQLVVPEIVLEEAYNADSAIDPMLALNPASIIPILVRSTQELAAMVKELQQEIAALKKGKQS